MRNRSIGLLMVLTAYLELGGCASLSGIQCDFAGPPIGDCADEVETYIHNSDRVIKAPACSKSTVSINAAKPREISTQEGETCVGTATDEARVLACHQYRNVSASIR
jgi:hypothetical protein